MLIYLIVYLISNLTLIKSIEDESTQIPSGSINKQLSQVKKLMVNDRKLNDKMDFVYANCGSIAQKSCYQNLNVYNGYKNLFGPKASIILGKKSTMHLLTLLNLKFSIIYSIKQFNRLINNQIISNLKTSQNSFLELLENILYERECLLTYELIDLFAQTLIHSDKLVKTIELLKYSLMDAFYKLANDISIQSNNYLNTTTSSDNDSIAINLIKWHIYVARSVKWLQTPLSTIIDGEFIELISMLVAEHNKLAIDATKIIDATLLSSLKNRLNTIEDSLINYISKQTDIRTFTGIPLTKTYFEAAINDISNSTTIDKIASKVILRDLFDYLINSNQFKRYNPSENLKLERFKF